RASSGSTARSFSAYTEVVPASGGITSNWYLAGLTWAWHTPVAAADTTYQWIIELATGSAGSEVTIVQVPASIRSDTSVGYVPSNMVIFPEPKAVAANTRIAVRVAYSLATTSNTLTGIKIMYQMA
ncbi:MAG: hypothetical protein J0651_03145, partial [Actinobacteria bacterium]|nr:hypothetical protein [Actinomycetota bacterium]